MFEIVEVADTFHDGRLWSSSSITWMTYGDVIVHVVLMRPTDHLGGGCRVSIWVGGWRNVSMVVVLSHGACAPLATACTP